MEQVETLHVVMEQSDTYHVVIEFLAHPLIVSIMTILLGSFCLDRINKRREKREKKVDGAIKLAEDISTILNTDLTYMFLQIRNQSFDLLPNFIDASAVAFKKRLKFKIRIQTYFEDDVLFYDYNNIIKEISSIKQSIERYSRKPIEEKQFIEKRIESLQAEWQISSYKIEPLTEPFNLYFSWAQIVWYKVERYSSEIYHRALNVK